MPKKKDKNPRVVEAEQQKEIELKNWVWFYYDQGFSIIPLKEKDKRPNIPTWKKYIQERPTKEEIQGWLDKKLFKNIGVVCGVVSDNLVVIDIDDKKIIDEIGIKLNKVIESGSWVVETGRGYHFYCKYDVDPGDLKKDTDVNLEYRANGGYVVAPPSIHPSNRKYRFLNFEKSKELPKLKVSDVKALFEDMVYQVKEKRGIETERAEKPPEMENINADCIKNVFKGGLTKGKRNDTAFALANYYKHVKKLNTTEIKSLVRDWNKRNKDPLPSNELNTVVNSALRSDKSTGCKKFKELGFCPYENKNQCSFLYPHTPNTPNTPHRPHTPHIKEQEYLIKHFLTKEKRPYENIGRGVQNDVCYIGTYIEDDDGKTHTAVVTSDRKMYIDLGIGKNQIKKDFNLYYREEFYWEILETTWSNDIIRKWIYDGYKVDIRDIFNKLLSINKKFIVYEDDRIHSCMGIDVLRSFFFFLFNANSRTFHLADPSSGKTNQMMIFRALMFNPIASPDFSSASIFRTIEGTGGTILIDDFDDVPEEEKQKINRHIKVNYKRFKAIRSDGGKRFRPQGYDAFSHLVFNNTTGLVDEITKERVVTYRMLKHPDAPKLEIDFRDPQFKSLRDDLYICLLQYWKDVKQAYDSLKVDELRGRELEIFKPQLAIAKVIGEDVYKKILSFAVEHVEQLKQKDLTDDWEYILLDILWQELAEYNDENRTKDIHVKKIAEDICNKLYFDLPSKDRITKLYQLRSCIGGKLSGYLKFKKTTPHGYAVYHVHKKGLKEIIQLKNMVWLLKNEGEVGEVCEVGESQRDQKNLDVISKKQPDLQTRLQNLSDFFIDQQKKGNKITYNNLTFNFDQPFIENAKRDKLIGTLPDGSYEWRGN